MFRCLLRNFRHDKLLSGVFPSSNRLLQTRNNTSAEPNESIRTRHNLPVNFYFHTTKHSIFHQPNSPSSNHINHKNSLQKKKIMVKMYWRKIRTTGNSKRPQVWSPRDLSRVHFRGVGAEINWRQKRRNVRNEQLRASKIEAFITYSSSKTTNLLTLLGLHTRVVFVHGPNFHTSPCLSLKSRQYF